MFVAYSLDEAARFLAPYGKSCITIGNFDGVHKAHALLLAHAARKAKQGSMPLVGITFEPHPLEVLRPELAPPRLTEWDYRCQLLERCGLDGLVCLAFTPELAALSPQAFIEPLVSRLGMRELITGYDFSLGKARCGTGAVLASLAADMGFGYERFAAVEHNGEAISSTRIRSLIRKGRVEDLPPLLGRYYSVRGTVAHGAGRGKKLLGFPTANIEPAVLTPPSGVYASLVRIGHERFHSVTSIGHTPTFDGKSLLVEAHIFDFDRDIYGQTIEVLFVEYMREQVKFSGPQTLLAQIAVDVAQARTLLEKVS